MVITGNGKFGLWIGISILFVAFIGLFWYQREDIEAQTPTINAFEVDMTAVNDSGLGDGSFNVTSTYIINTNPVTYTDLTILINPMDDALTIKNKKTDALLSYATERGIVLTKTKIILQGLEKG